METHLTEAIRNTPEGKEAEEILRRCVHCGFCTATCPTYQLLGDELDSPRGRIYLIKEVLEGAQPTERTQLHLDRCLTCRSCETTCPSGVHYHRLLDIGRGEVARQVPRRGLDRARRRMIREVLGRRTLFTPLLRSGQMMRALLPDSLRKEVPVTPDAGAWPEPRHDRRMVVLEGCVQPALAPRINAAAARVLDRLGISLVRARGEGCCGAMAYHLDAQEEGLEAARRNIDAWWPHIEDGAEAVVVTASGCGAFVKDYGTLLRGDPRYAAKAARVDELSRDLSEILAAEDSGSLKLKKGMRLAFHSPCSLQHGLQLNGVVEQLLRGLGLDLAPVADAHLCCGSAGTYSVLQPEISGQLRAAKLEALQDGDPDVIATANIGCLVHLQLGAEKPVQHWIEVLDQLAS
jgi:glycolate oxidase iron-sulfur subunit